MSGFSPSRDTLLRAAFVIGHLALPIGIWAAVRIGRPRFVGLSLYIVTAVVLIDVLLFLGRSSAEAVTRGALDTRFPVILLIGSAGVLALVGKGLLFYLGVTATLLLVLLRSVSQDETTIASRANLLLTCGTSVLLIASKVLTVAYFVRVPDTINHTTATIVLLNGESLSAIESTRYFSYSAFHLLASTGMRFTQLRPRMFMSVLMIAFFQIALLAAFLFFRNWGQSRSLALIGIVLISINTAFLHYAAVPHYQSMSFVFFCVFLALLTMGRWSTRYVTVTAVIVTAWIVTHHVSILMVISLLATPIGYLAIRTWKHKQGTDRQTVFVFSVFCLMFGVYWAIVTTQFREVLVWTFFTSSAAEGIPSDIYLVQTINSVEQLLLSSIPFFLDSLHYSFLLALACIGLLVLLRTDRLVDLNWRLALLGFLPAAVLYFPNPAWIPLEGLIPFQRWRLMVLPLLMLVPAAGFRYGIRPGNGTSIRRAGVVVFTVALVFVTITSGMAYPALTDFAGIQKGGQDYITDEELTATEFVFTHMTGQQDVYARSELMVYLHEYAWALNLPYSESQFAKLRASQTDQQIVTRPGLTVVSVAAFRNQGLYARMVDVEDPRYTANETELLAPVHTDTFQWDRTNTSVVYSNGDVVIQHQHVTRETSGPS